jgi:hypothetical protein
VISVAATPAAPAAAPRIIAPAPYQASFGRVIADLPSGTVRAIVVLNGHPFTSKAARGRRVAFQVALPAKDSTVRVLAVDGRGRQTASAQVAPVFGLPAKAAPRAADSVEDSRLRQRLVALARSFPGTAAVYVHDLVAGTGAAWNARARFPAGSTLKLAIAVEALRSLRGPPAHGSRIDVSIRATIIESDNKAANELEVALGGSTSGGSARVNAMMRSLGLVDSEMYGGYETDEGKSGRPIPIGVDSQPSFPEGKYTTAGDIGRLLEYVYLAAGGRGPLVRAGAFSPAEARYLLYLLVHVADPGKLDRFLPGTAFLAHKAGWIAAARHDNGLVFWPGGAFAATVMTYGRGVGLASDVLAGRIAETALERFRR